MNLVTPSFTDLTAVAPGPVTVTAPGKPGMSAGTVVGALVVAGLAAFGLYMLISKALSSVQNNMIKKHHDKQKRPA